MLRLMDLFLSVATAAHTSAAKQLRHVHRTTIVCKPRCDLELIAMSCTSHAYFCCIGCNYMQARHTTHTYTQYYTHAYLCQVPQLMYIEMHKDKH